MLTHSKKISRLITKYIAGALLVGSVLVAASNPTYADQQLNVPEGASASLNWSGYVAEQDSNYTSVTGTWTVPSVSANTSGTADAAWVGIGGVKSTDLIQVGTQAIVEDGQVAYSAWIEMLPGVSQTVPLGVNAGDSVTGTLTEESPGMWGATIQNNTTGKIFSTLATYDSTNSSAEWIQEMVSNVDGTFRPLDDFGSITFTGASATVGDAAKNLQELQAHSL